MRVSRDSALMSMAQIIALRSTCNRLGVGAIIARDGRVISSGYNGNAVGMPHCNHKGGDPCDTAVHAECNAIVFAARHGMSTEGAELFTTHEPCLNCAKIILNSGITRVVFKEAYRDHSGFRLLSDSELVEIELFGKRP